MFSVVNPMILANDENLKIYSKISIIFLTLVGGVREIFQSRVNLFCRYFSFFSWYVIQMSSPLRKTGGKTSVRLTLPSVVECGQVKFRVSYKCPFILAKSTIEAAFSKYNMKVCSMLIFLSNSRT